MRFFRIILGVILLTGIIIAFRNRSHFDIYLLQEWLNKAGYLAPLAFISLYALSTIVFLPGSVLTISGGILFGPVLGTIFNLTGATIGAIVAFLCARFLVSKWIAVKSGKHLGTLVKGIEAEGWRFVVFVRLVPLFPFNLLNYALGLTKIKLGHYALASLVGMLPGAFVYTYIGYTGREAIGSNEGIPQKILISFSLLLLLIFIPYFIKRIKSRKK